MGKRDIKFYKVVSVFIIFLVNLSYSQEEIPADQNKGKQNIKYSATDSIIYDLNKEQVFLYKDAKVNYDEIELTAGFISIHFGENIIFATGRYDTLNNYVEKPVLKEKNDIYNADTIRYNYKSKVCFTRTSFFYTLCVFSLYTT